MYSPRRKNPKRIAAARKRWDMFRENLQGPSMLRHLPVYGMLPNDLASVANNFATFPYVETVVQGVRGPRLEYVLELPHDTSEHLKVFLMAYLPDGVNRDPRSREMKVRFVISLAKDTAFLWGDRKIRPPKYPTYKETVTLHGLRLEVVPTIVKVRTPDGKTYGIDVMIAAHPSRVTVPTPSTYSPDQNAIESWYATLDERPHSRPGQIDLPAQADGEVIVTPALLNTLTDLSRRCLAQTELYMQGSRHNPRDLVIEFGPTATVLYGVRAIRNTDRETYKQRHPLGEASGRVRVGGFGRSVAQRPVTFTAEDGSAKTITLFVVTPNGGEK